MDRRTYLVGVGTVAVAGCLGFGESDEDEPGESEQDGETEAAASSGAEPEPEPQTESSPTAEKSEPEDEPEPESDDRQQSTEEIELERSIASAEEQFREAMREYGKSSGREDGTLLHLLPSTEVETHNAREYLDRASDILWTETRDHATTEAEKKQVREYRTYDDLIVDLVRIQRYIHRAYTRIGSTAEETMYHSSPSELTNAKTDHEAVGEELAEKEIYIDDLQIKYEQQQWQITLLERMFSALVNIKSPEHAMSQSSTQLQLARNELWRATGELKDTTAAPPEDSTDEEFLALAEEWYDLTDEVLRETST